MLFLTNWMLWILNLSTRKQTTLPNSSWSCSGQRHSHFPTSFLSPRLLSSLTYPISLIALLLLGITSPHLLLSLPQNALIIVIFYTKWILPGWWKRSEIKSPTMTLKKKFFTSLGYQTKLEMGGKWILGKLGERVRVDMIKYVVCTMFSNK